VLEAFATHGLDQSGNAVTYQQHRKGDYEADGNHFKTIHARFVLNQNNRLNICQLIPIACTNIDHAIRIQQNIVHIHLRSFATSDCDTCRHPRISNPFACHLFHALIFNNHCARLSPAATLYKIPIGEQSSRHARERLFGTINNFANVYP
jgi:hypothetical protein